MQLSRYLFERTKMPVHSWCFKGCSLQRFSLEGVLSKWRVVWPLTWSHPRTNSKLLALCKRELFQCKLSLHACPCLSKCFGLQTLCDLWLLRERHKLWRSSYSWMPRLQQHWYMYYERLQTTASTQGERYAYQSKPWWCISRGWK